MEEYRASLSPGISISWSVSPVINLVSRKEKNQLKMKADGAKLNNDFLMRKGEMDENMNFLFLPKLLAACCSRGSPVIQQN